MTHYLSDVSNQTHHDLDDIGESSYAVHYQPKLDLNNGRISGLEALLKLKSQNGSYISHSVFIDALEKTERIVQASEYLLRQVVTDMLEWHAQAVNCPRVSINISQLHLLTPSFVQVVRAVFEENQKLVGLIELAMTESRLIENFDESIRVVQALKSIGVKISIDEFGSGYSSLRYLKKLPISTVKIAGSLMKDVVTNSNDAILVRAIIRMAHELGYRVIASGVNQESQVNFLSKLNCDEIQGEFISAPIAFNEMTEFMKRHVTTQSFQSDSGTKNRTLLLVDDEANITTAIKRLLRSEGYSILTAKSGQEGLEILASHSVGVIISDQRMPEMTGVEFLSKVKIIYPETIRIVLSGYTDLKSITEAINEGSIYKFITKPWEDDELISTVRSAFEVQELKCDNIKLTQQLSHANQELEKLNRSLKSYADSMSLENKHTVSTLQIFQKIIHNLPYPLIGVDNDGLIVIENDAAIHRFAHKHNQSSLIGMFASDFDFLKFDEYQHLKEGETTEIKDESGALLDVTCQPTFACPVTAGKVFYFTDQHNKSGDAL